MRDNIMSDEDHTVLPSGDEQITSLRADDDQLYIESYSHFSIHEEMLKVSSLHMVFLYYDFNFIT